MESMYPFRGCAVFFRRAQVIGDMNALYHQHFVFLLDFADYLRYEIAVARPDLTRFQRASKGAGESATGCGDEIIEGCGMGFVLRHVHAIAFGDLRMDAKENRLCFLRHIGATQRAAHTLNAYVGPVDNRIRYK